MKTLLTVTVSAAALVATPAFAQSLPLEAEVQYNNEVDTRVITYDRQRSDVELVGTVRVNGRVEVDSSANAVSDLKQNILANEVDTDDFVDFDGDPVLLEGRNNNDSEVTDVSTDGNVGINSAAGYNNAQANLGTIAAVDSDSEDEDAGGMARANTTAWQLTAGNAYTDSNTSLDDDGFIARNNSSVSDISGDGNIGINSAAGAFNAQANVMTIATASNATLADASAGVLQTIAFNETEVYRQFNNSSVSAISGSGNVGINSAAGFGNSQFNSLTIAASAGGGGGGGNGGNGGGDI